MLEAVLARFKDAPSLVAPEQQATFEGCLSALAKSPDLPKLMAERASSDFWFAPDDWRSHYRPYNVKDGILTIPVKGVLLHDFPWSFGSWATGYEYIWQAFSRGMEDNSVRGIAFHCHSPGGDVAGNFDMVDKMFAMRGRKPIRAFAHEAAYSAAYSIASVADKIVVSRTGGVGSIGVVTAHWDVSKAFDEAGIKITFIHFGKHKVDGNPFEALTPEVKTRIQKRIDDLGEVFVSTVARNRGMDAADVKSTEALTYSAQEAIEIGLADDVGPLDDAVAAFAADLTATSEGDEQMSDFTQAQYDEGVSAAKAAGKAEGMTEGAAAERIRIAAILDSDSAKERPASARMLAFDTDKDAASAEAMLSKLPVEAATTQAKGDEAGNGQKFDSEMKKDQPKVGAEGGNEGQPSRASRTASLMGWDDKKK